jgi:peptide/nickel transport system permease protein
MVMPTIAVAAGPAGIYQRLLRSDMTATLREDYIAMAEAKGQSPTRILLRHALRPSMFSLMTLVGLTTAAAIGGSVVVEVIFGLPGIGRLLINSIERRDVVVLQGVVAFIGVGYVALNGFVDILYGVLDPRVRRG